MTDPITLAVATAVVSKSVEKLWDIYGHWLTEVFGSHSAEAQQEARENTTQFIQELAIRIDVGENVQPASERIISRGATHPQFSYLLQKSILNAAKTDDRQKHALLAQLIADRLATQPNTTFSLASEMVSDAITLSTPHQLKLMAICGFLEDLRPRDPLPVADYRLWLNSFLTPFSDFEFRIFDARHLVAVGCASFDRQSGRDLDILLQMKGGLHCIGSTFTDAEELYYLQSAWVEGMAGVQLTSVGSIVGCLALDQFLGINCGLPDWD